MMENKIEDKDLSAVAFAAELERLVSNFKDNMVDLHFLGHKSREYWMTCFLEWAEWETSMHEEYWK